LFFVDSHCHINSEPLRADAPGVVRRAAEAGVGRILVAGSDPATSAEAVELAHVYRNEGLFAAVGVHPHDAKMLNGADELPESLLRLADDPRVAAIGETGLDYHYDHSPRDAQKASFRLHIAWAAKVGKPLVVHVREAMEDALAILRNTPETVPLLFHCYAGGLEHLDAMRGLDAYLSLGGPVTWAKNAETRKTAAQIPENRLLCETDAPWLTPEPHRGKLNEPAYVRFVYERIAAERGLSVSGDADALARAVDANAARLFGWTPLYV
jgi:TatD DNase family protein